LQFLSELKFIIYTRLLAKKDNEKLIRKLLIKDPKWKRGHRLISELTNDLETKNISIQAVKILS